MSRINIVHVSDAHIEMSGEMQISKIVTSLCDDLERVSSENNLEIDFVCFSGDMIHRGDQAISGECQWELAQKIFVNPILDKLDLERKSFIVVPGNHEVDCSKINEVFERGLDVSTLEDINRTFDSYQKSYSERIGYFYDEIAKWYDDVQFGKLGYSFVREIKGKTVGIACIDSSWRSSGKGWQEKGHLYVCEGQIEELFSKIKDCDLKIAILHHPVDWLIDSEENIIERALSKFNIVLNGHVHENDNKQSVRYNYNTIFSTAGKVYPVDKFDGREIDGYNGYTVLSVDTDTMECTLFVRSYYGMTRGEFDVGTNICEGGKVIYKLGEVDSNAELEFALRKGIISFYKNLSEKFSTVKMSDKNFPGSMEEILVESVLSRTSEYIKEKEEKSDPIRISLDQIILEEENQLIIGKKETGKTTVLQQIGLKMLANNSPKNSIPIYVNFDQIHKGKERIYLSAYIFVSEHILDQVSISKDAFKSMLEEGKFALLLDNVDIKKSDHCMWVMEFIDKYPNCQCFVTVEEGFFQAIDIKQMPQVFDDFNKSYIQYLGRNQIRQLVSKWSSKEVVEVDDLTKKIDMYCNQINLAKTPFNISVFMVIWDYDGSFIPTNEGILMQNYLEIVLEKLSPNEARRDNYAFYIKEDFLASFAYLMYQNNEYALPYEDFVSFVTDYHKKKGYNLKDSKFDVLFFEKNILVNFNDNVSFSRTSFLEYFLAVFAIHNDFFLNEMLEDGKIEYFRNEFCFYAGLQKDCSLLLDKLSDKIVDTIIENIDLVDELNGIEILTEFKVDKEEMLTNIQSQRLTIEEVDEIADSNYAYEERKPNEIQKQCDTEETADNFYSVLDIYGGVLKNAELLDNDKKTKHLENYMYGMNMLYAMMIKLFEKMDLHIPFDELSDEQRKRFGVSTEEEFKKIQAQMLDFTKLFFPIALQNLILESVGTPKLKAAIDNLMKEKENCAFEKFMLLFLKADLGILDIRTQLSEYIKSEKSKSILKIAYIKLTYYYRMRVFGRDERIDRLLLDLISEIYIKLNPIKYQKMHKSKIAQLIKKDLASDLIDVS